MRSNLRLSLLVLFVVSFVAECRAAIPPEVRKELLTLSREIRGVTTMIRKKEVDEAKALIKKVEDQIAEFEIDPEEKDRTYRSLMSAVARAKAAIPVSFEREVASIFKAKCLRCHGQNNPRANLRLNTFANMGRGGANGALLVPGNPQRSLLMARLMTEDAAARMPKSATKLSDDEINVIGRWVAQGARFDGKDRNAEIGQSTVPPKKPVKVVEADGTETVSFKEDVAPWMVNVCLNCHSGNNPRGGYNITTFEQLLTEGDSGSTIVPGDPDNSYIVDLVLRQDPIKMPQGNQVRIKRSQAVALETWIKEGAKFDGGDPKATLRSLVPTEEEMEAAKLAAMSNADFNARRIEQAETTWKRIAPREETRSSTSDNLYVYGNLPQSRLDQIAEWGEAQVTALTGKYRLPNGQKAWRGRLIVFVTKDRFDYEEFNTILMNRRTPRSVSGHARVTNSFGEAYVAMHDVGDEGNEYTLATEKLVNSMLAQAYLARNGTNMPDWLQQGFGLMESKASKTSALFQAIPQTAGEALRTVTNPATLFDDGTFSPDEVGPVGYLLTQYLIRNGGMPKLAQYVRTLQTARNSGQAIQTAYGSSAAQMGAAFLRSGGQ